MCLIIVAHGSPSNPEPQEAFVKVLATSVANLTGAMVRGATLAYPGALEAALDGLTAPLIFPHFMSDGWFVSTNLQDRLARAGAEGWVTMTPLGMDAELPKVAKVRLKAELSASGMTVGEATLVVAAHGSPSDPRPAKATEAFASVIEQSELFCDVRLGYVDQAPELSKAAKVDGPCIVLPFFAARAGHVLDDLPSALTKASFNGRVLDPIGVWEQMPRVIADAFRRVGGR